MLLYFILSGRLPFKADTRAAVFNLVKSGSFSFDFREFSKVSDEAKSFIRKLLVVDPARRLTPEQALKDEFFLKHRNNDKSGELEQLDPSILRRLREFRGVSTLKKAALNILVKMTADSQDIEVLRRAFA